MAVMSIDDPRQLKVMNRKQRLRMSSRKGRQNVDRVIIQEGIPTIEKAKGSSAVAEPVIYMIGQRVVGEFYRTHASKKTTDNLNSPGMQFEQVASPPSYVNSVIARLSLLAMEKEKYAD